MEQVHTLVQQTHTPEDKASLFLDLSNWLFRRSQYSFAINAAFAGLDLLTDTPSAQHGDLEFALGYALMENQQLAEALRHYQHALTIHREIGDKAGEGVSCWNLAMEYNRRGDLRKAIEYTRCTVAIDEETQHPALKQDRAFLEKTETTLALQTKSSGSKGA